MTHMGEALCCHSPMEQVKSLQVRSRDHGTGRMADHTGEDEKVHLY